MTDIVREREIARLEEEVRTLRAELEAAKKDAIDARQEVYEMEARLAEIVEARS